MLFLIFRLGAKCMKKFKMKLLLAMVALLFMGCGSNAYLVMDKLKTREPLKPDAKVAFLFATNVPLVPEKAEHVATMENNMETHCSADEAMPFFEEKARELGANVVFVKSYERRILVHTYYTGVTAMTTTKNCEVLLVDFYSVPEEAIK